MAQTATSETLLTTYNFAVEIDNVVITYFKEVSGISSEIEVIEHQVVNEKGQQVTQKVPGHQQTGEITLKKSFDAGTHFHDWHQEVKDGKFDSYRRNGSIIHFDPTGKELARWTFVNGWPKSLSVSDLDAGADDIALEELVITHEGLTRKKG